MKQIEKKDFEDSHIEAPSMSNSIANDSTSGVPNLKAVSSPARSEGLDTDSCNTQMKDQILLNMENVIFFEDRIWAIGENLRKQESTLEICEDYWEMIRQEAVLFQVHRIFKDEPTKKGIRKSLILQLLTVSLLGYLESQEEHSRFLTHLRNLVNYTHQNFLCITQLLIDRFPPETMKHNIWANALRTIIQKKLNPR